ncbi:MAG: hypothetical protein WA191_19285 [Telluria sp.]
MNQLGTKGTGQVQSDEISEAIAVLSVVTSIKHEFDCLPTGRNGGHVRHVLEIGDRRLLAWFDDVKSVVVVTPLECWDADTWVDVDEDQELISVLSFRQIDGITFQKMAARTIPAIDDRARRRVRRRAARRPTRPTPLTGNG